MLAKVFKNSLVPKKTGNKVRTELLRGFSWKRPGPVRDSGAPVFLDSQIP
jgi:hypothetical protein